MLESSQQDASDFLAELPTRTARHTEAQEHARALQSIPQAVIDVTEVEEELPAAVEEQYDEDDDDRPVTPFSADSVSSESQELEFEDGWNEEWKQETTSWTDIGDKIMDVVEQWDQLLLTTVSLYTASSLSDTFLSLLTLFDTHPHLFRSDPSASCRHILVNKIHSCMKQTMLQSPQLINDLFPVVVTDLYCLPAFFDEEERKFSDNRINSDSESKLLSLLTDCCTVSSPLFSSAASSGYSSVVMFLFRFLQSNLSWYQHCLVAVLRSFVTTVEQQHAMQQDQWVQLYALCRVGIFYLWEHAKGKGSTYYDVTTELVTLDMFELMQRVLQLPAAMFHVHTSSTHHSTTLSSLHPHVYSLQCTRWEQQRVHSGEIEIRTLVERDGAVQIVMQAYINMCERAEEQEGVLGTAKEVHSSSPVAPLAPLNQFLLTLSAFSSAFTTSLLSSTVFLSFMNSCCYYDQYDVDAVLGPVWCGLMSKGTDDTEREGEQGGRV